MNAKREIVIALFPQQINRNENKRCGKEKCIEAVEDAAMTGENVPCVFHLYASLEHGFYKVANHTGHNNYYCDEHPLRNGKFCKIN